jgi:hypothetical protein
MERWEYIPLSIIVLCFLAVAVGACDVAYHHWQDMHSTSCEALRDD